jgi:hypothetical protein
VHQQFLGQNFHLLQLQSFHGTPRCKDGQDRILKLTQIEMSR